MNSKIVERSEIRAMTISSILLITVTIVLFLFGIVMVFSASSVELMEDDSAPWKIFLSQATFGLVGFIMMWILSNLSLNVYEKLAFPVLVAVNVALLAVQVFGYEVNGNKNWISIGGMGLQPSELAKLVLCVWLGLRLAKIYNAGDIHKIGKTFNRRMLAGIGVTIAMVLAGGDLGTAMIFMIILFGEFYIAGVQWWLLAIIFAFCAVVVSFYVQAEPYRQAKIVANYTNCEGETQDICYQSIHGIYALQTGGLLGVGPGASREKWSYLPESHNDFIFSIIGEELGFVGAFFVIICYICLIVAMVIIMNRNSDVRVRIITGAILTWICSQAIINISVVLRILPVVGVPLPLVSAGGTSLISTMMAIGVVLSFTKTDYRFGKVSKQQVKGIKTVVAK